ncbi:FGGY-family carbohydrate kinase [Acidipropionibacterium virtanenii]|uniref:Erythritol kinase n=1 Tax=Acidipropionibacterium virtanenii TaxID=2057246 RepID=A0A344UQX8_9ACTN|nr:FGGY-family carbohydrate kinase [Acidipropionibacterium virtanenii]AXE37676.1 Erythritol kinase [Acidipropionibacterium virtanenii]
MSREVVLGVDGGTTAVKAVAFDLDGEIITSHHESVPVQYGRHGEAEQDMNLIWEAVADCIRAVAAVLEPDDVVVSVGLTGQGDGAWLIDDAGEPVRPAATWLDGRAGRRVNQWMRDGRAAKVLGVTGTTVFGGLFPVLMEELLEDDPERAARATTQFNCKDWIRFKLTGERLTDYTEASRSYLDVRDVSGFSTDLAEQLGQRELVDLLPEVRAADAPGGVLSAQAAARVGLPAGTPVGMGMIDVAVTGMGLGTVDDGQGWLILGTTGFVGTLLPSVDRRRSQNSMVLATGRGRQVLEFMAPMTGTPNLDWIRDTLGLSGVSWAEIERRARASRPGANGVVYLPYASPGGERAPFIDTAASASWMGMSLTTTPDDVLRSVYEGVAFSLADCVRTLDMTGNLVVSGGGFRSDLVCEILADVTGQTVVRQDAPEAGARGAAVLALVSAGRCADLEEASRALACPVERFEPDADRGLVYRATKAVYLHVREAIRPAWPVMRGLREQVGENDS